MNIEIHNCECCGCASDRTVVYKLARVCPRCCGFGGISDQTGYGVETTWSKAETLRRLHAVIDKHTKPTAAEAREAREARIAATAESERVAREERRARIAETAERNRVARDARDAARAAKDAVREAEYQRDVAELMAFCRSRWQWEVDKMIEARDGKEEKEFYREEEKRKMYFRGDPKDWQDRQWEQSYAWYIYTLLFDAESKEYALQDATRLIPKHNAEHYKDDALELFTESPDMEWVDNHLTGAEPSAEFLVRHYGPDSKLFESILIKCRARLISGLRLKRYVATLAAMRRRALECSIPHARNEGGR